MATLNVQFTTSAKAAILAYFSCPQDQDAYPNQGTIASSDAMWKTYFESLPAMISMNLPTPG